MELKDAIDRFKTDIEAVRSEGKNSVEVLHLIAYLDDAQARANDSNELRRPTHEGVLAHYSATNGMMLKNFRNVIGAGKEAINSSLLIDGGGAHRYRLL